LTSASTDPRVEAFLQELNCGEQIRILYRRYGLWFGWAAMFTIVLANVAALITGTIINVAIPDIMGTFGIGQDKAQWLATSFLASSTVTMLLNSWLIHTLGVRFTVIAAMTTFMAGSVLGGISPTMDLLIAARILQGAATGVITPMGMSMVFQLFPAGRQGLVLGVTSIGIVLAPAVGTGGLEL
jgi:MFS family permease